MKKTVPFSTSRPRGRRILCAGGRVAGDSKKVEVVAVLVAYEILGRYEAPLREAEAINLDS